MEHDENTVLRPFPQTGQLVSLEVSDVSVLPVLVIVTLRARRRVVDDVADTSRVIGDYARRFPVNAHGGAVHYAGGYATWFTTWSC